MALFVPDGVVRLEPGQKPLHFVPPTSRERRAQAVHRLQVGLLGLAGMLLLVGLANIILTNAKENQARVVPEAAATVAADADASDASDPLAAAGVVPDEPQAQASDARPASQR